MQADISPVWFIDFWELCLRLGVAVALGGLIGIERELSNHPAGFRTHILVCIGSALIMLLSIYGFSSFVNEPNVRVDPSRLAAQVINGIGFLGAGTIIRKGISISGLTTAASLWITAGIGLAVGAGFYAGSLVSTLLVLISLFLLNKFDRSMLVRHKQEVVILVDEQPDILSSIMFQFGKSAIEIKQVQISLHDSDHKLTKKVHCSIKSPNEKSLEQCMSQMMNVPGVLGAEFVLYSQKIAFESSGEAAKKEVM